MISTLIMKSIRKVMSEDNATPERDLNQLLPELPDEDFFFWLCFWLADLLAAVLTGLIVSSFSAVAPDFFDLDFLFALPDFLLASPPFDFELWLTLGLPSPSAPIAPAICRLFSWRSWAARRSLSRYSDLKLTQTLTCKMCRNVCELKGHSTQLATRRRLLTRDSSGHLAYSILGRVLAVLQCGAATNDFLPGWRQRIPLQVQIAQTTQATETQWQILQAIVVEIQVTQMFQLAKILGKNTYLILAQIEFDQTCECCEIALSKY